MKSVHKLLQEARVKLRLRELDLQTCESALGDTRRTVYALLKQHGGKITVDGAIIKQLPKSDDLEFAVQKEKNGDRTLIITKPALKSATPESPSSNEGLQPVDCVP